MSKDRSFSVAASAEIPTDILTLLLKRRAVERTTERGHAVETWYYAKKRFGKGAQTGVCARCAMQVSVVPKGEVGAKSNQLVIVGEAVFEDCPEAAGEGIAGPRPKPTEKRDDRLRG